MNRKDFLSTSLLSAGLVFQLPFTNIFVERNQLQNAFSDNAPSDILYDAIICGGSYAGLSVAMGLGRSLRKTLVIDVGLPRNRMSPAANNLFSRDGQSPTEIKNETLSQLEAYKEFLSMKSGEVKSVIKKEDYFEVFLSEGTTYKAKFIVFASGLIDELQDIEGLSDLWGRGVYHCPYCHGWENRGKKAIVIGPGNRNLSLASMLTNWNSEIVYASRGITLELPQQSIRMMQSIGISINEKPIKKISGSAGNVVIHFKDETVETFETCYAPGTLSFNSLIASELGCELTPSGAFVVDENYATTTNGCYAIGDVCNRSNGQIIHAAYSGTVAAAQINNQVVRRRFM